MAPPATSSSSGSKRSKPRRTRSSSLTDLSRLKEQDPERKRDSNRSDKDNNKKPRKKMERNRSSSLSAMDRKTAKPGVKKDATATPKSKKGSLMNVVDKLNRGAALQRSNSEGTMSVFTSAPPDPSLDIFQQATADPDKPSDWASYWLDHKKDRKKEAKREKSDSRGRANNNKARGVPRQRSRSLSDLKPTERRSGKKKPSAKKSEDDNDKESGKQSTAMAQWESILQQAAQGDKHDGENQQQDDDILPPLNLDRPPPSSSSSGRSKKDKTSSVGSGKKSRMAKTRSRSLTHVRRKYNMGGTATTTTTKTAANDREDDNMTQKTELSKVAKMALELDQQVSEIGATFNWIQNGRQAIDRMSAKAKVAVRANTDLQAGERARSAKEAKRTKQRQEKQLKRTVTKNKLKVKQEIERSEVISVTASINQSLLAKAVSRRNVLDDDDRTVLTEYTNSAAAKDLAAMARQSLASTLHKSKSGNGSGAVATDMLEHRLDRIDRRSIQQKEKLAVDPRLQAISKINQVKGQVAAERAALMESEEKRARDSKRTPAATNRRANLQRVRSRSLTDLRRGLAKELDRNRNTSRGRDDSEDDDSVGTRAMNARASAQSTAYLDTEPDNFLNGDQDVLDILEAKNRIKQMKKQLKDVEAHEAQELANINQQAAEWSELNQATIQTKKVIKILRLENEAYRINQKLMKEDMFTMHQQAQRMAQEAEDTYKYYTQLESLHKAEVIKARALARNVPQFQASLQQKQVQLKRRVMFVRFENRLKNLYTKYLAAIVGLFQEKSNQGGLVQELATIALGQYELEKYEKYFSVLNNSTTATRKGGSGIASGGETDGVDGSNQKKKQDSITNAAQTVNVGGRKAGDYSSGDDDLDGDTSDDSSCAESSEEEEDDL